jgi:hypothetical protein
MVGKVYLWAAVLVLAYNDGRIDFDVRRDVVSPTRIFQWRAIERAFHVTGYDKILRALNRDR